MGSLVPYDKCRAVEMNVWVACYRMARIEQWKQPYGQHIAVWRIQKRSATVVAPDGQIFFGPSLPAFGFNLFTPAYEGFRRPPNPPLALRLQIP